MEKKTIIKLNQLNQDFYNKVAQNFNQSRQYYWQGWTELQPVILNLVKKNQSLKVLDLGCGNARFADFLSSLNIKFEYTGVDSNQELLKIAGDKLKENKINANLVRMDLVTEMLGEPLTTKIENKFDLITVFGVVHHIPGNNFRSEFINQVGSLLKNQESKLVVTAWQFAAEDRFSKRIVEPEDVGLDSHQLEANDYLLDWRKGKRAVRYCHYVSENEIEQIKQELKNLKLSKTFLSDGKSNQLNRYLIFQKLA